MVRLEETIVFENYSKLFDFICGMDSEVQIGNLLKSSPQLVDSNWRFVCYSSAQVDASHPFAITTGPNFQKAYFDQLGLLEICAGDYRDIQYIPITADLDWEGLKKNWLRKYCRVHGLALSEPFDKGRGIKFLAETSVAHSANPLDLEGIGGSL